jgi:serine/threonine protein kinase
MNEPRQVPTHSEAGVSLPTDKSLPASSEAPELKNLPVVPDYELLRRIGRGAYGDVWLARSKATGVLRAAKIVWRHTFEDNRPFQREFEGIQRFERISREHPSQLALFHIGRNEPAGYFYYVMELADVAEVPGAKCQVSGNDARREETAKLSLDTSHLSPGTYVPHTLRADLDRGRLPANRVLEIGLALSEALGHLHRNGLVHRDVKPSNVIFVNGRPKLADIGLVTDASDRCSIVGTEGYLPPEGPGTPQADIFALGKVLYEAATGLDRREFPKLPEDLRSWPDAKLVFELNEIILKACAQDSKDRYQTCEEMHEDLALLEKGKSVKHQHLWQRRMRVAWRTWRLAAIIVVAAVGGVYLWQALQRQGTPVIYPASELYRLGFSNLRLGTDKGFLEALAAFNDAIRVDPQLVPARARLFEVYLMDEDHGISPIDGRSAKLDALAADLARTAPTDAETHAARAIVLFLSEWKWKESEDEFKQALEADPGCRMALTYYGYFLTRLSRNAEAHQILERALTLDPTSALITKFLGHAEFGCGRFEESLRLYLRASELEPAYPGGHYCAGRAYLAMTNYPEALNQFEQWDIRQGMDPGTAKQKHDSLREALSKGGERGYWRKRLEMAKADISTSPYTYAELYARLGENDKALDWLKKAVVQHDSAEDMLFDRFWDEFHNEPKFTALLEKAGFSKVMAEQKE